MKYVPPPAGEDEEEKPGDTYEGSMEAGKREGVFRRVCPELAAAALNCTAVGARGGIHSVESIEALVQTGARYADTQNFVLQAD